MAQLRKEKDTPYWFLRYRDLDTGKWRDRSLKLRWDIASETREAIRQRDKFTEDEKKISSTGGENFSDWVWGYMEDHYKNPNSLARYQFAWASISEFLLLKRIRHPKEFTYSHAMEFLKWRKLKVKHNTARMELKFIGFLMAEAKRRGIVMSNPILETRIPKEEPKLKQELDDSAIEKSRIAFSTHGKWMEIAFEILIHLGCRFNESRIHKSRVDYKKMSIQLVDSKRSIDDPRRLFLVPLTEQLATYLKRIEWTDDYTVPPLTSSMNQNFNSVLFKACGATSHSCRVSFITRCHRAGLTESQAMILVNHSTKMVHKIYTRLNIADSTIAIAKVQAPPPPVLKTP